MEPVASILDVRRLHPMTLVQRFILSLPGFVILLMPVIRAPSSADFFTISIAVLYGVLTLPFIFLQYQRFRYWITPKELVIHSGVLTRRRRNIPVDRIQNIEIEQKLLPRLLGTARVKVVTAGSDSAEGVLEYVSLSEARRIREAIRTIQKGETVDTSVDAPEAAAAGSSAAIESAAQPLISLNLERVLLSGAFRFSLLYIALIFSALQFFEPDPEALIDLMTRGRFNEWANLVAQSPWMAAAAGVVVASLLSWVSGILVNLNKYYGFRLSLEGTRLYKKHGLLTIAEGTIPLKKIQTLIYRTNPLMSRFGWWIMELQTMGLNVREHGHQVAVPFARSDELRPIERIIFPVDWPESLRPVSSLTVRRMSIRYGVVLATVATALSFWWKPAVWAFSLIPLLIVWAYLQYRHHGYATTEDALVIRRGFIRRMTWYMPIEKFHVFYLTQSIFQRRLGLKTLFVDTAGASSIQFPMIVDLPAQEADRLMRRLYDSFQRSLGRRASLPASTPDHADSTDPDTTLPARSSALPGPAGQLPSS